MRRFEINRLAPAMPEDGEPEPFVVSATVYGDKHDDDPMIDPDEIVIERNTITLQVNCCTLLPEVTLTCAGGWTRRAVYDAICAARKKQIGKCGHYFIEGVEEDTETPGLFSVHFGS